MGLRELLRLDWCAKERNLSGVVHCASDFLTDLEFVSRFLLEGEWCVVEGASEARLIGQGEPASLSKCLETNRVVRLVERGFVYGCALGAVGASD